MSIDNGNDSISMYKAAKLGRKGLIVGLSLGMIGLLVVAVLSYIIVNNINYLSYFEPIYHWYAFYVDHSWAISILICGAIAGIIGWIVAYYVYRNYYKKGNYNDAKGVETGILISIAICVVVCITGCYMYLSLLGSSDFYAMKSKAKLNICESVIWEMGYACLDYARDHDGCYPDKLSDLITTPRKRSTPGPIKGYYGSIPPCTAAGKDTYSVSYTATNSKNHAFTMYCSGHHHPEVPENYPRLTSKEMEEHLNNL